MTTPSSSTRDSPTRARMEPATLTALAICALAGVKLSLAGYLAWTRPCPGARDRAGGGGEDEATRDGGAASEAKKTA